MLLIHCPWCEAALPELEFRHAGEAHIARPTPDIADSAFADRFYLRDNPRGVTFERWRHMHGCGRFFNAVRHTVSDQFVTTYRAGEPRPDISPEQIAAVSPKGRGQPANEPLHAPRSDDYQAHTPGSIAVDEVAGGANG